MERSLIVKETDIPMPEFSISADHADLHRKIDTLNTQVDNLKESIDQKDTELQEMRDYFDRTKYYLEQLATKITGIFTDLHGRFKDLKENTDRINSLQRTIAEMSILVREHQNKIKEVPSNDEVRVHMLSTKNEIIEELNVLKAQTKELRIDDDSLDELRDHITSVKNDMLYEIDDLRKKLTVSDAEKDLKQADAPAKSKDAKTKPALKQSSTKEKDKTADKKDSKKEEKKDMPTIKSEDEKWLSISVPTDIKPAVIVAQQETEKKAAPDERLPQAQPAGTSYDSMTEINKMLLEAVDRVEQGMIDESKRLYKDIYTKYLSLRTDNSEETQRMYKRITSLYTLIKNH
jgi:chromosome segregation ATPase